jgi:hypothetical protein
MAIAALFRIPDMTAAQYDRIIAGLDAAGLSAPAGRRLHVASLTDDGVTVFGVWDSEEALRSFGARLGPIAASTGATMPPPEILPVHNVIVDAPLAPALS